MTVEVEAPSWKRGHLPETRRAPAFRRWYTRLRFLAAIAGRVSRYKAWRARVPPAPAPNRPQSCYPQYARKPQSVNRKSSLTVILPRCARNLPINPQSSRVAPATCQSIRNPPALRPQPANQSAILPRCARNLPINPQSSRVAPATCQSIRNPPALRPHPLIANCR